MATLETGLRVTTPLSFVTEGDSIIVNTEKGTYVSPSLSRGEIRRCVFYSEEAIIDGERAFKKKRIMSFPRLPGAYVFFPSALADRPDLGVTEEKPWARALFSFFLQFRRVAWDSRSDIMSAKTGAWQFRRRLAEQAFLFGGLCTGNGAARVFSGAVGGRRARFVFFF